MHSAINKFVVYEKFSEMNNKYDVNNFSKILEEYNNEEELNVIKDYMKEGRITIVPKFDFIPYESKMYNLSSIQQEQLTPPKERLS